MLRTGQAGQRMDNPKDLVLRADGQLYVAVVVEIYQHLYRIIIYSRSLAHKLRTEA
jgi:hypothetical protein